MIRKANLDDRAAITQLIKESARNLSREDYSEEQIEGAIATVFGVDTCSGSGDVAGSGSSH